MARRLADSLVVLRDQVNQQWPNRSKASDSGIFPDAAHQKRPSDHNPNSADVVCAFDITHDPAHGVDTYKIADNLRVNRHPNLKYLISNRRIAQAPSWNWQTYSGTSPHTGHMHISVGRGPDGKSVQPYDDKTKWSILGGDMSTVGEVEFNHLFFNFFGDKVQPTAGDRKRWIGAETNTAIRQMFADPRRPDYQKYVGDLEKAVQSGGTAPTPPTFKVLEKGKYEVK